MDERRQEEEVPLFQRLYDRPFLLLGFGLRQFSMHPAYLLAVKQVVLQTGVADLAGTTQKILRSHVSDRIENLLQQMNV